MTKKGFTLIELLAVIVILAIIALITIPLVYNITKKSRRESYERSIDLYATAIRNAISEKELDGEEFQPGKYSSEDFESIANYEGDVECEVIEIYEDGKIYLEGCKVNKKSIEYVYGTKQEITDNGLIHVYKPQYYTTAYGNIGEEIYSEFELKDNPTGLTSFPFYLGVDIDSNNKVTAGYVCFVREEKEYCLAGYSSDPEAYKINVDIIKTAFKDKVDTSDCYFDDSKSYCSDTTGNYSVSIKSNGYVEALYNQNYGCGFHSENYFCCTYGY